MNKLTPHPTMPNHFIVESNSFVPLSVVERERITRLFQKQSGKVVSKSIETAVLSQKDPNRVFDSASFFNGLVVTPHRAIASKSAHSNDRNDCLDSLFPFIQ